MSHETSVPLIAAATFRAHQVLRLAPLPGGGRDVLIGRPDSGIYRFRYLEHEGRLYWTGDIGTAVLQNGYGLAWLIRNATNHSYVAEKVEAMSEPTRVYTREAALAALDDARRDKEEAGTLTEDLLEQLDEMLVAVRHDGIGRDELQRMWVESDWHHDVDDIPSGTEWSATLCWLLEAAALTGRLVSADGTAVER